MTPPTLLGNSAKTLLYADNNGQLQNLVEKLLLKCSYKVIVAGDGKEALRKAREFDGIIDLLLADIEIPDMTGIELAIQLNRVKRALKC